MMVATEDLFDHYLIWSKMKENNKAEHKQVITGQPKEVLKVGGYKWRGGSKSDGRRVEKYGKSKRDDVDGE